MKNIKIAYVVNNYAQSYDGVGAYAEVMIKNFPSCIQSIIYSANCATDSQIKRILSFGMTGVLFRLCRELKGEKFDAVLIEYPFAEWQPMILLPIFILFVTKGKKTKLLLSLHEYLRSNKIRRFVIRIICSFMDAVLVTDEVLKESVQGFAKRIFIRFIPSNIFDAEALMSSQKREKNYFCYFGIVNKKTKAFDEMMSAWDKFNSKGTYTLNLLSCSDLGDIERIHNGVVFYHNASDREIIQVMKQSAFCILPIIPQVDLRSGTLKAAALSGCACIGKFAQELKKYPFIVDLNSLTVDSFTNAFEYAAGLSFGKVEEMSENAANWGSQYTPSVAAEKLSILLQEICDA